MKRYNIGEIYWVNLKQDKHVQGGWHPAVIVQNNVGNRYSPTIAVVPITSKKKSSLPTHVPIKEGTFGLPKASIVQCEGQRPVNKLDIGEFIGEVNSTTMKQIANACLINTPLLNFLTAVDIARLQNQSLSLCS